MLESVHFITFGLLLNREKGLENITEICSLAAENDIFVRLDMEDHRVTQDTIDVVLEMHSRGKTNVGCVLQSRLFRTKDDIEYLCKNLIISFFVSIIPVLIWNYFCIYNNIGNTNSDNIFNINNFANRILYLKNYILIFEYLLLNEKFLFGLIVFLVSTIYIKNNDILIYVSSISLIYILFLFIVYLSTPLDLEWHLNSANRIIKPIALFLSIFSLYSIFNKQHKI